MRNATFVLFAFLVGASACAAPRPRTDAPPRIKDSPPEKAAAQRAALSNLKLEAEDERWGVEAARERKQRRAEPGTTSQPLPRKATDLTAPTTAPPGPR